MHLKRQFFLISCLLFLMLNSLKSQAVRSEDDREPSRIGYGVNLGNIRFYNRAFEFGLSPNVAYRVGESLAFGLMLKADYFYQKDGNNKKFSAFDLGPTVFTRYKPLWSWDAGTPFLRGIFLQAEFERGFLKRPYVYTGTDTFVTDANGDVVVEKITEDFLYLGVGLASGFPFSSVVSLHYNVLDGNNPGIPSARFPWSYRIGFTYNY